MLRFIRGQPHLWFNGTVRVPCYLKEGSQHFALPYRLYASAYADEPGTARAFFKGEKGIGLIQGQEFYTLPPDAFGLPPPYILTSPCFRLKAIVIPYVYSSFYTFALSQLDCVRFAAPCLPWHWHFKYASKAKRPFVLALAAK
ncbi:hypothetical protein TNIN_380601 [Trichonephila inaurata madagascariensis]|uniref:Uncharacterized protein n=1 Tax=Trichonephila inaurata madagascariensis TaxID=2747483 RepID=A0A8X6IQW0_9ARAC|nr:hypothetical protein TNIN_380601 [Trichonephila inaurata madagascariensis]